jgi:hypothetical protein
MTPWWDQRRRHDMALCGLVMAGLVVALAFRALFLGETFVYRDLAVLHRPSKAIVVPLARAWQGVPLWNPLVASGQPFAANPEHALFHPLTALLFVLPFEWVFRAQVLLPLVFGALSMRALLRGLGRSRHAALFGAVAWGFGGYLLSAANLLPILFAASTLPLVLLCALRVATDGRLLDVAALALAFGVLCLAGEPSTLLAAPALLAALLWRRPRRRWGALLAGLALGAALGAAAMVPGARHASRTIRADGLDAARAAVWSLPAVRALELVTPNLLGRVDQADEEHYWGSRLYPRMQFPLLISLYPGLLTTVLAGAAFCVRRRGRRATLLPWLVLAVVGFLLALGGHLPLWGMVRRVPLLSGVRYPEKLALLVCLPLVVAAAHGFDQLAGGPPAARRSFARVFLAVAAAALLVGGGLALALPAPAWRRLALENAARLLAAGVVCFLLCRYWARAGRRAGAIAACLVLAADLATAGRPLLPTAPVATVATPPAALRPILADADRHLLFHLAAWDPELGVGRGIARPPVPAQWGLATTLEQDFALTQLRWTNQATAAFFRAAAGPRGAPMDPLLRRRGVTDVLRFAPGTHWRGNTLVLPPGASSPLQLQPTGGAQPFAFAAARVEMVRGETGWIETVRRLGEDVVHSALVDVSALPDPSGLPLGPGPLAPAVVSIVDRAVGRIQLDVQGPGPGASFVAINQTWDEGWKATIDDVAAPLVRTELDLSGLVVPAGHRRVELAYDDPWVHAGLALSGLAGLGCLALVIAHRRRRRGPW